ncbi:hypothetical protein SmJEL517_g04322 [Synchytrium microbalum]|uniref:Ribosomal protein L7Ae/L30e/S12e/Gadd45 domain-containing protein n=1 Tax=Synchytrium microbalum TaxID=1806994 RepID=A0A507BZP7_9FUNG|nr:uncharacterized protein SmJEL517_g04322 [Synchytrium microbalum]TPX32601.1 hypothetical protein SmJEL517_g04322 [Synchytrium microbalum]
MNTPNKKGKKAQGGQQKSGSASNDAPTESLRVPARRPVFKHVVDSPFVFQWQVQPAIAAKDYDVIMDALISLLQPIGLAKSHMSATRKRVYRESRRDLGELYKAKRQKIDRDSTSAAADAIVNAPAPSNMDTEMDATTAAAVDTTQPTTSKKQKHTSSSVVAAKTAVSSLPHSSDLDTLKDLVIGINDVSRVLEGMIPRSLQSGITKSTTADTGMPDTAPKQRLRMVFVCRSDLDPPHLYTHIPTLVCLASPDGDGDDAITLCGLNAGAEDRLARALGVKRVGCLAVKTNTPNFDTLYTLIKSTVALPSALWLKQAVDASDIKYLPTQIKTVATTAPVEKKKTWAVGEKRAAKRSAKMKKKADAKVVRAEKKKEAGLKSKEKKDTERRMR